MRKQVSWIWLSVCVFTGVAAAQGTGGNAKRQPPNGGGSPSQLASPDQLRSSGGSLLRATMANLPADAPTDPLEAVSFFHVPAPAPRTIAKHDLVTIIIREESTFRTQAKSDIKRDSQLDARLEEFIKLSLANFALEGGGVTDPVPSIKASAERSFKGDGKTDRTDSFIARIQAEVVDVKPNGTLVLQARKRIKTDDEEQVFVLSGVCRADDVTADNSVLSTQLFDLELAKSTKGPVRDGTRRGAVHRFLDWLNPF